MQVAVSVSGADINHRVEPIQPRQRNATQDGQIFNPCQRAWPRYCAPKVPGFRFHNRRAPEASW